ncbi:MAG TPA: polyphosphate kinase 1 [Vicinamibacterales bacterium]|jgi:polyphosphate kinase|nr:polyphosphate kinase 1 [Vicinamibacterales bacterium]
MSAPATADAALFINRELSWLAFNERVLAEARDPDVPLLERLKFAAITASNLDEFFMVRVAGLEHAVEAGEAAVDLTGLTPDEQLAAVTSRSHEMVAALYDVAMVQLLPALAREQIRILTWQDLGTSQTALSAHFRDAVLPVLTPLAIDEERPFPLLSSLSLNLALLLDAPPGETAKRLAIVQVPGGLTRLVRVLADGQHVFVMLEELIRAHLSLLFPGQTVLEATVIRLARDAEMELDDEGGRTHLEVVERELRRRRRSGVIRLEMESTASPELQAILRERLDLNPSDIYLIPGPLDLRGLLPIADLAGFDRLRYGAVQPADVLAESEQTDLFAVLDDRDVLMHHPYESYDPVIALVQQAADDPDVLAIKQTLYRTSLGSPIIAGLQRAAESGKQVTVLVELTARFDEERNIKWARALEEAGAHVIYGVRGYKTHAKICLIVRRTPQGLRRYVHLGTGNYNERTARIYTDFGLMTASEAVALDASAFFSTLTGYSDPPRLKKLVMAPANLRQRFVKLIDRERRRAEAGQPAEIMAKMNSLSDKEIIESLYAASRAGVRIKLNIRGICALRPGVPGVSESIEVISVVDRFLEHSRIYSFLNAGDEQVYLASADMMTRNLDKRIELMFPIEHAAHKQIVMHALRAMFRDNVKARRLDADGVYRPVVAAEGEPVCRVQQSLLEEAQRRAAQARDRAGLTFRPEHGALSST